MYEYFWINNWRENVVWIHNNSERLLKYIIIMLTFSLKQTSPLFLIMLFKIELVSLSLSLKICM